MALNIKTGGKYARVDKAALQVLPALLKRWLPGGKVEGDEYLAINPKRPDNHLGSFKINLKNGKWADFATDDKGRGAVSLASFLFDMSKSKAVSLLSSMLISKGKADVQA